LSTSAFSKGEGKYWAYGLSKSVSPPLLLNGLESRTVDLRLREGSLRPLVRSGCRSCEHREATGRPFMFETRLASLGASMTLAKCPMRLNSSSSRACQSIFFRASLPSGPPRPRDRSRSQADLFLFSTHSAPGPTTPRVSFTSVSRLSSPPTRSEPPPHPTKTPSYSTTSSERPSRKMFSFTKTLIIRSTSLASRSRPVAGQSSSSLFP
jgi:hypothetical protein